MTQISVRITIPEGVDFADLKLERDPETGVIRFDWAPLEAICEASDLDIALLKERDEDNVAGLIWAWYAQHRQHGGAPDPVQEALIAEVEAEDIHGLYAVQKGGTA